MKKSSKVACLGLVLAMFGGLGTFNAISVWGEAPEQREDVEATGRVTHVTMTELKHATGIVLTEQIDVRYEFQAADGQTYHGQHMISEGTASVIEEGQKVTVLYHSNNPSINGCPALGTYVSVDALPSIPVKNRLIVCVSTLLVGLVLVGINIDTTSAEAELQPAVA